MRLCPLVFVGVFFKLGLGRVGVGVAHILFVVFLRVSSYVVPVK